MSSRGKFFVGLFIAALLASAIVSGDPKIALQFGFLGVLVWLIWRGVLFVAQLLLPVRRVMKPYVDPLNDHLDQAMRRSGMSGLADVAKNVDAGVQGALREGQERVDARGKR